MRVPDWFDLPRHVWSELLLKLNRPELLALRLTCKGFRSAVDSDVQFLCPRNLEVLELSMLEGFSGSCKKGGQQCKLFENLEPYIA